MKVKGFGGFPFAMIVGHLSFIKGGGGHHPFFKCGEGGGEAGREGIFSLAPMVNPTPARIEKKLRRKLYTVGHRRESERIHQSINRLIESDNTCRKIQ